MPDYPVSSRASNTEIDFSVSAPFFGQGDVIAYSDESLAAELRNLSDAGSGGAGSKDVLYRVDSGSWNLLPPGGSVNFAIDLSAQTITMKRGQFASDVSMRLTATGPISGLYAADRSVPGGGGFSGDYDDLTNKPSLGTAAAAATSDFDAAGAAAAAAAASIPTSALDTDDTLAANSNANVPSQKAVKKYVDDNAGGITEVTDGTTTLTGLSVISFPGAMLTENPSGTARVEFSGLSGLYLDDFDTLEHLIPIIAPLLVGVFGNFAPVVEDDMLTTMSFPLLTTVGDNFVLTGFTQITSLSCPALNAIGCYFIFDTMTSLESIDFSGLKIVGAYFDPGGSGELPALTSLDISSLETVVDYFKPQASPLLETIDAPALVTVGGDFGPNSLDSLTTLGIPNLAYVGGNFFPSSLAVLTVLNAPSLTYVGDNFDPNDLALLTTLSVPLLTDIGGILYFENLPSLASASFPALLNVGDAITDVAGTTSLTTLSINSGLLSVGGDVTFTVAPLDQTSVDALLVLLAALDGTGGTTTYDNHTVDLSGNCAVPSATGLTAKATLEGRGNIVTVNQSFPITTVVQGAKTFTVTDAGAVLNGATGTILVTGSTGNDGTYTIDTAVSGAGLTVITVVEAIPDTTADGDVIAAVT